MRARIRVSPRREGFTLIELLVGMTVGILLVVVLFQIFNVAATAWQRSENEADAFREARAAMQLMTRDLSSACTQFPVDPAASPAPLPTDGGAAPTLVLDKYPNPDPEPKDGDEKNEQVYCLTTIPNTGLSSLCAVGYFCQWLPDVATTPANGSATRIDHTPHAYSLFRQFLGSGAGADPKLAGLYELMKGKKSPLDFMDVFVRSRPNPPSGYKAPVPSATAVEMASYIWDLQFRIDTNLTAARGAAQPPKDHGDLLIPKSPVRTYAAASGAEHPAELPSYIEIRFKALSAAGARQLEGNTSVDRSTWWNGTEGTGTMPPIYKNVILPSTQQFVARVPLQDVRAGITQ